MQSGRCIEGVPDLRLPIALAILISDRELCLETAIHPILAAQNAGLDVGMVALLHLLLLASNLVLDAIDVALFAFQTGLIHHLSSPASLRLH